MADYRHILAPVDINHPETSALRRAAALAMQHGARLTLLHVIEHFPEDLPVEVILPENVDPQRALMDLAAERIAALCRDSGCAGADVHTMTSTGSAKGEIIEFARRHGVDLIVIGAHRKGYHLAGLGSTSGGLLGHAACDVLVVKPAKG